MSTHFKGYHWTRLRSPGTGEPWLLSAALGDENRWRLYGGEALYLRPNNVGEALSSLASQPWSVLAGGTDFYPVRAGQLVRDDVLDVSSLAELRFIAEGDITWRIRALTT